MKQIIDHCLRVFLMIISMIFLIFLLLFIPKSVASAAAFSRDQILVIGKVTENPKKFDELNENTMAGLKEAKDLLQIVRDKLE